MVGQPVGRASTSQSDPVRGPDAPHHPPPIELPVTEPGAPGSVVQGARLRLALVLPEGTVPGWALTAVNAIRLSPDVELVVVLLCASTVVPRRSAQAGPALRALLDGYGWVDRRVFGRPADPTDPADSGATLAGLTCLGAGSEETAEALAERLARYKLDVVVRFARPDLDRVAERIARSGVWSYRTSARTGAACPSPSSDDHLPAGLAEMLRGSAVTVATLEASRGPGRVATIASTVSATDRISLTRGMRGHLAKVAHLAPRALRDLRRDGRLPAPPPADSPIGSVEPATAFRVARRVAGLAVGYVVRLVDRKVAPERWIVALCTAGENDPLPDPARTRLQHLVPPAGRSWADPFLVQSDGQLLLFVEEWIDRERRGRIALVRLDEAHRPSAPETVLAVDGHLSYPQVFTWRGTWYLLPEQAARGGLQLYRAESFPTTWTFDRTLIADPPLADATIAEINGRWWLFAAGKAPGGTASDELLLYSADAPIGPWRAHVRNPVLSDIRSARPAGRLVQRDGQWYRPAQDGSVGYGWALSLNRIDRLDDEGYRETRVARLLPNWRKDVVGTHTLSEAGGLTAIDLSVRWPKLGREPFRSD